jgi:hypothetical protein
MLDYQCRLQDLEHQIQRQATSEVPELDDIPPPRPSRSKLLLNVALVASGLLAAAGLLLAIPAVVAVSAATAFALGALRLDLMTRRILGADHAPDDNTSSPPPSASARTEMPSNTTPNT